MQLDERGIPVFDEKLSAAPEAPPAPCQLCPEGTPLNGMDPWAWCLSMNTCAATIDWEKVFHGD